MRHGFNYVVQKLTSAIFSLSVGTGSQQERLYGAYRDLHNLDAEAFPEGDRREEWESIHRRLRAREEPEPRERGNVRHTLDGMSDEDATALAKDIVELYFACQRHEEDWHSQRRSGR